MKKITIKELSLIAKYRHDIDALCNFIENICNDEYERGYSDGFHCGYSYKIKEEHLS